MFNFIRVFDFCFRVFSNNCQFNFFLNMLNYYDIQIQLKYLNELRRNFIFKFNIYNILEITFVVIYIYDKNFNVNLNICEVICI